MGAWGPAIFSDDTAADVRSSYRELLEDQVSDDEATRQVIAEYEHLEQDESHVLWLALAAAQHQVGRLEEDVKRRAVGVIDSEEGLELWADAGLEDLKKRKAALAKLREQLTGPQPARKALRRPWRHVTDLTPGTVLAFTTPTGAMALFRVLRIEDHRVGAAPVLERLDWRGPKVPSRRRLGKLGPRVVERDGGPCRPERYLVSRFKTKEHDWVDVGFSVVGVLAPRAQDATAEVAVHLQWRGLAKHLRQEFGSPT